MKTLELSHPVLAESTRFWDKAAAKYAADPIADMAGYERTLARVAELLGPQDRVLELGCGTGTTALRLAPAVAHYVATDLSPEMVRIAESKRLSAPSAVRGKLEFHVASTQAQMPTKPQAGWDAILAFNVLHLVHDLDECLAHVASQLRPGGLFISKTACIAHMNPLIPHVALPLMRFLRMAPPVQVLTQDQLIAAIWGCGLSVDSIEHHASKSPQRDWRPFIWAHAPA